MAENSRPCQEEWELLPSNTSFLEFGLEDIKDLISTEIDYMDYLREEHMLKLIQDQQENQWKKPVAEYTASTNQVSDDMKSEVPVEFVSTNAEDPKQSCTEEIKRGSELEDKQSATVEEENSAERPCCKRSLAASIGILCSLAAAAATAACVVLLGGGLHHHHRRRERVLRFHIYADKKALKRQTLVATGRDQPPALRTATISFRGYGL